MKQINKISLNYKELSLFFFVLFEISLFFPIRYVFSTPLAFKTGAYSDFTSLQLFFADIFLIISAVFTLFSPEDRVKQAKPTKILLFLLILWLVSDLLLAKSQYFSLNLYFFTRFLGMFVAYETAYFLCKEKQNTSIILYTFLFVSVCESVIALAQFHLQRSVGLHKLGEQVLLPQIQGLAKIVSGGTSYIRGYGTFFHPNLLSAFLVTALFINIYFLLTNQKLLRKLVLSACLVTLIFGLLVTFSRASFLAFLAGALVFFGSVFWKKEFSKRHALLASLIIFAGLAGMLVFWKFLATRTTISDSSSLERIFYFHIGQNILKHKWLFGTGMGESVLHMQQYTSIKLWPWQIQPVHNYYLLSAVELGITGFLLLAIFFLWHFFKTFVLSLKNIKAGDYLPLTVSCVTISFLVLMLFDHYFYTLVPTQYLLWLMLGLSLSQIKNTPE